MDHVRWHARPSLHRPTLIAAFTGWNDAGDSASAAVRTLIESWDARPLVTIDPEEFTDFATTRPHVRLAEGGTREIVWPTVSAWYASVPGGDVILLLGPEPSLRWRAFCEQITGTAAETGVGMVLTLGALLADVPHNRAVNLIGTATDQDLIDRFDLQRSRYEGPTGIVGVLHDACTKAGIPTMSLWAAVPAYASQVPSPKAAVALVRRACDVIGTPAPVAALGDEVLEYEERVDQIVDQDQDLVGYVRRLESMADAGIDPSDVDLDDLDDDDEDEDDDDGVGGESDIDTPSLAPEQGEILIEEVERFLRDQGQA
jgi:proteasome assembly chaperone (PAC2) family protein